jgi:hypothetical protein
MLQGGTPYVDKPITLNWTITPGKPEYICELYKNQWLEFYIVAMTDRYFAMCSASARKVRQ